MSAPTPAHVVPRHAAGVELRPAGEGALLVGGRGAEGVGDARGLALDPTALALWELCDGETTVEEMTLAVCALFDASPETARSDITALLDTLDAAGLLEWASPRADP